MTSFGGSGDSGYNSINVNHVIKSYIISIRTLLKGCDTKPVKVK